MSLRQKIEAEIRERGPIPFSRYMELCLYDPELGYYSRNAEQFGKAGDFYTSSDVHAVFGRLLARQFEEIWRMLGSPPQVEILELGPGRGLFAQDVLDWCEKMFPKFFAALLYSLDERSPALRERLSRTLSRHFSTGKASLCAPMDAEHVGVWVGQRLSAAQNRAPIQRALAPEVPLLVFANEFFDAFPVEILSSQGKLLIGEKQGHLVESWAQPSGEELAFLDHHGVHLEAGERIEVPLAAQKFMVQLAAAVRCGVMIVIDYGYTRQEQLAGRHRGTLMTFRRHSAGANPYDAPGEQDITAHVNFAALVAAAQANGIQVQPLLSQSQFLLGIGEGNQFADAFEACRLPQERAKVGLQLKHLITPEGMGESFKVLVGSKGVPEEKISGLSGLSFGKARA